MLIMAHPKSAPVIPGTGGIRKVRFGPERWDCGARGGVRVLCAHLEEFGIVLTCLAYGKGEVDNIFPAVSKQLK